MKNTLTIDTINNCTAICLDSLGDGQNSIYLCLQLARTTGNTLTFYDNEETAIGTITTFARTDYCMVEIPPSYYPEGEGYLYFDFSDGTTTSQKFSIHFPPKHDGNLLLGKNSAFEYWASFKQVWTDEEITDTVEEISDQISNITTDGSPINEDIKSVAVATGSFMTEDELNTNKSPYFLKADASYNKATKTVVYNSDRWLFTNGRPSTFTRQHTEVEGSTITLRETTYPEAAESYSEANTQAFEINGQQVYYTAIGSDSGAYESLMLTSPTDIYGSNVDTKAFEVRMPKVESSKIVATWEWEKQGDEFVPVIRMGAGNISGNGKAEIQTELAGTKFTHKGQYDGASRGIKILDDGLYYSNNGTDWIKFGNTEGDGTGSTSGSYIGGKVSIIDHAPTTDDLTGDYAVIVQYDGASNPVLTGAKGTLYNAVNTYIEVPSISTITIDPESPTVYTGRTQQFTGYINGTAQAASSFTWSVEGATSSSTTINNGLLTVGNDEAATTIQIKATSTDDPNKYGTTIATVEEAPTGILYDSGEFKNPMDSQLFSGMNSGLTIEATELVKNATISDGFIQLWFSERLNTALFNHFNVTFTYTGNYPNQIFIGYCHADTIPTGAPSGTNSNMNAPRPTSGEEMTQTLTLINYGECYMGLAMRLHTATSGYMKIQIKKIWVD